MVERFADSETGTGFTPRREAVRDPRLRSRCSLVRMTTTATAVGLFAGHNSLKASLMKPFALPWRLHRQSTKSGGSNPPARSARSNASTSRPVALPQPQYPHEKNDRTTVDRSTLVKSLTSETRRHIVLSLGIHQILRYLLRPKDVTWQTMALADCFLPVFPDWRCYPTTENILRQCLLDYSGRIAGAPFGSWHHYRPCQCAAGHDEWC
jgi:hypothetical protein